ncbi:M48 family metallopeptidase [Patescibacteria group bacterium]|nr:M48 family metallopeptidase [Patescibacteria group bacterium]
MATLYTHASSNTRKSYLLISLFFVFIIAIGFAVSWYMNDSSILIIAVLISVLASFFSYYNSHKILLNMAKARELKFEDNKEIYRLVENLCITAGLPLPKIYIIDDPAPNAFTTGRNKEKAVIALSAGLIQKLDKSELEGVIAHELSHIGNRDMLFATLVTVLVGSVVILADMLRYSLFFKGGDSKKNPIFLVILIAVIIIAPIFAYMIKFAISRKREFLADADGALLTRYPEGLANALEKISADENSLKHANSAMAHLFIASPLKDKKGKKRKSLFKKAFMTHPPIEERIAKLRSMQ